MNNEITVPKIEYTQVEVPKGYYKLSPSGLSKFKADPKEWYYGSDFSGNVATATGTCIHFVFECLAEGLLLDNSDSEQYGKEFAAVLEEMSIYLQNCSFLHQDEIEKIYSDIISIYLQHIIDFYQHTFIKGEAVVQSEVSLSKRVSFVKDYDMVIAGSTDAIVTYKDGQKHIVDFKWTGRKISNINPYLPQLMAYAYAATGITHVSIININWTKTKGVQFTTMTQELDKELKTKWANLIKEIGSTLKASKEHPELIPVLFRKGVNFMGKFEL